MDTQGDQGERFFVSNVENGNRVEGFFFFFFFKSKKNIQKKNLNFKKK